MPRGPSTWRRSRNELTEGLAKAGLADAEIEIDLVDTLERHKETGQAPALHSAAEELAVLLARHFAAQGMMGTTLIAFAGEPSMIFELTAR